MAIVDIATFNPTDTGFANLQIKNNLPGLVGNWIVYNDSGITLKFTWNGGTRTKRVMAGTIDLLNICIPETIVTWEQDNVLSNASSWPASIVLIDGFSTDEKLPYSAFPVPLNRANNIGNQIVVSSTSSINVFNVKSYGAVGDGTTDDSAAIQAAINAAIAAPNSSVYFPAVDSSMGYLINTGMSCPAQYIRFMGDGWGSRIIAGPSLSGDMLQVTAPVSGFRYGIVIEDLFFDGNSVAGVSAIHLISTYGALVRHCRIRNISGKAIYLDGVGGQFGAYNNIRECHITDVAGTSGTGIETNNSEWAKIIGNHFAFYSGGTLPGSPVIACKINNLNCLIEGNSFDHCDTGVNCRFAGKNTIVGNEFDRGYQNFIWLQGSIDNVVANNVFCSSGSGFAANASTGIIRASDSANAGNVIIGNTCTISSWDRFLIESSGIGSTSPNQYIANYTAGYPSTLRGGVFGHGTANTNMIGYNLAGQSGLDGVLSAAVAILSGSGALIRNNFYYDGTNFIYIASDKACQLAFVAPPTGPSALVPAYDPAPSGTAGNPITFQQRMYLAGASFFSGTGDGVFSHGLGVTPEWVGLTDSASGSTQTVGAASYTSTQVTISTGAGHAWKGVAMAH